MRNVQFPTPNINVLTIPLGEKKRTDEKTIMVEKKNRRANKTSKKISKYSSKNEF